MNSIVKEIAKQGVKKVLAGSVAGGLLAEQITSGNLSEFGSSGLTQARRSYEGLRRMGGHGVYHN